MIPTKYRLSITKIGREDQPLSVALESTRELSGQQERFLIWSLGRNATDLLAHGGQSTQECELSRQAEKALSEAMGMAKSMGPAGIEILSKLCTARRLQRSCREAATDTVAQFIAEARAQ